MPLWLSHHRARRCHLTCGSIATIPPTRRCTHVPLMLGLSRVIQLPMQGPQPLWTRQCMRCTVTSVQTTRASTRNDSIRAHCSLSPCHRSAGTLASGASTAFFSQQVHFFTLDEFAGHEIQTILEDGENEQACARLPPAVCPSAHLTHLALHHLHARCQPVSRAGKSRRRSGRRRAVAR